MRSITVFKLGNTIKISISGKLQQKTCGSDKEANDLYRLGQKAKEDPSDENLKAIRMFLNEKTRVAMMAGLECDVESGEIYLAGFNTPIPNTLVDIIKEYHENGYPLDAIINFWKLLMINPDTRVRTSLFDFITKHDFVLTDKGYMVVYKAVYRKEEQNAEATAFAEYISNQVLHVKKNWKCSPSKYIVYKDIENDTWNITKKETAEGWNESEKNVEILGNLGELFNAIYNSEIEEEKIPTYTDMHTRTMTIQLGRPTGIQRVECDSDPSVDCSYGLHCGATKYVENFANNGSVILACLVNPANVVAVPKYDHSKMRVSEYFPFAYATYTDGKIDIIEQSYFEDDYCTYEVEELQKQIELVQADELPIQTAMEAEEETRPMSELLKMIESRLVDIE